MKILNVFLVLFSISTFAGNEAFDKTLGSYEKLHKAFFDNDLEKVKSSAGELLASIDAIKDEKIGKTLDYTKKKLSELKEAKSLDDGKDRFGVISRGLLVVLEKHAPNKSYAKYYCPMVKKYWIQNITVSEKVMNPYASSSMPHCGEKK
jgi:hypothetical protein